MTAASEKTSRVHIPPRWFVRTAWAIHRGIYALSGGRRGLRRPRPGEWGMLRLRTTGARTGQERAVIVAYYVDGEAYVTMAMNGWQHPHPAWLHNLRAHPDASIDTVDGPRRVTAREVTGAERDRLWEGWRPYASGADYDAYVERRGRPAPIVVLEPRP